jgi:hypothetical protein
MSSPHADPEKVLILVATALLLLGVLTTLS